VRLRTLFVVLCSSLPVAVSVAAAPALAGTTSSVSVAGGSAAGSISTSASGGAAPGGAPPGAKTPVKPAHAAPITARTPNIAYAGPVYEKTATGQLVAYAPPPAITPPGQVSGPTGGAVVAATATTTKPELLVPGHTARIVDGLAAAPIDAPVGVQEIIWAGNQIVGLPYIYGGGHASFVSPGYDCSGTVSYALHGASLLATPMDSTEFEGWGGKGVGTWVTIFANGGHAYMTVAGVRLDTSPANDPSNLPGPRWRPLRPENSGFVVRHPLGL
jgi:cell wall-associated NlpC family hydrolase